MCSFNACLDKMYQLYQWWYNVEKLYSVSHKKENPDLISNLWKTKRRITKLITENDSTTILLSWHINHAYWLTDDCSAIIFVKHVKTVSIQVLSLYTKQCWCTYCCFVVKAPANAIMQHKQRLLGQNQFDMFYKMIAVQPSMAMNELCTKLKLTNYAIMRWNQFCYICFQFWEILSQTRVLFYATQSS